ncbi:MAG: hypothetical protein L0206_16085 [Actinobacteria bacterium]|nr:hypothetical protein [Actinomycetota bacterium]
MALLEEEMGDDEVFALFVSLALGLLGATLWYVRGLRTSRLGASRRSLATLFLAPVAALAALWIVLASAAAVEVRTDVRYQFLFVAMGLTWVFLLPRMLSFIGVSYRDDALERRNASATIAIVGAIAGLGLLFTGSNMGEGPSIWNTVVTALAATVALLGVIFVLALSTHLGQSIAVERDVPTGLRFAGLIAACGMVLGRAAAGSWVSTEAMITDLAALGWPVVVLLSIAIVIERALRPRESDPRPSLFTAGVLPAAAYLALSVVYVAVLPGWRGD